MRPLSRKGMYNRTKMASTSQQRPQRRALRLPLSEAMQKPNFSTNFYIPCPASRLTYIALRWLGFAITMPMGKAIRFYGESSGADMTHGTEDTRCCQTRAIKHDCSKQGLYIIPFWPPFYVVFYVLLGAPGGSKIVPGGSWAAAGKSYL